MPSVLDYSTTAGSNTTVGVMDNLPNSGTPAGIRAMLPGGIGSGIGATLGSFIGPWGTAEGIRQ